jgi:hypothetical protein
MNWAAWDDLPVLAQKSITSFLICQSNCGPLPRAAMTLFFDCEFPNYLAPFFPLYLA